MRSASAWAVVVRILLAPFVPCSLGSSAGVLVVVLRNMHDALRHEALMQGLRNTHVGCIPFFFSLGYPSCTGLVNWEPCAPDAVWEVASLTTSAGVCSGAALMRRLRLTLRDARQRCSRPSISLSAPLSWRRCVGAPCRCFCTSPIIREEGWGGNDSRRWWFLMAAAPAAVDCDTPA